MNLKEKLLSLDIFKDNEWLDKYVNLIELNKTRVKEKFKTDLHHIVPRVYYTYNNLDIDNSEQNTINLLHKDHLYAHYYLAKCSKKFLLRSMICCIFLMLNTSTKKLENLTETDILEWSEIYSDAREDFIKLNINKGRQPTLEARLNMSKAKQGNKNNRWGVKLSDDIKLKISNTETGKLVTEETRLKISLAKRAYVDSLSEEERHARFATTTGYKWYTNGEYNIFAKECPDGYHHGRTYRRKRRSN